MILQVSRCTYCVARFLSSLFDPFYLFILYVHISTCYRSPKRPFMGKTKAPFHSGHLVPKASDPSTPPPYMTPPGKTGLS